MEVLIECPTSSSWPTWGWKHKISRAKALIQKSDKATQQHFSWRDHGELVYVFSISDKQTTSNCPVNLNIKLTTNEIAVIKSVSQK